MRGIQQAAAYRFVAAASGILDQPLSLTMTVVVLETRR
jgi:hypothetical protein